MDNKKEKFLIINKIIITLCIMVFTIVFFVFALFIITKSENEYLLYVKPGSTSEPDTVLLVETENYYGEHGHVYCGQLTNNLIYEIDYFKLP